MLSFKEMGFGIQVVNDFVPAISKRFCQPRVDRKWRGKYHLMFECLNLIGTMRIEFVRSGFHLRITIAKSGRTSVRGCGLDVLRGSGQWDMKHRFCVTNLKYSWWCSCGIFSAGITNGSNVLPKVFQTTGKIPINESMSLCTNIYWFHITKRPKVNLDP